MQRTFTTVRGGTHPLFAAATRPDGWARVRPRVGVLLLHGAGSYRSGAHDLLVAVSHRLCDAGYLTIRPDLAGHGDSLRLHERLHTDGRLDNQLIGMAADVSRIKSHIVEIEELDSLVTVGLCSGAMAALRSYTQQRAAFEKGLVLMAIPPLDMFSFRYVLLRMRTLLLEYWLKLLRRSTWKRLFSGDIDVRAAVASLGGRVRSTGDSTTKASPEVVTSMNGETGGSTPELACQANGNDWLQSGILCNEDPSKARVLLITSTGDVSYKTITADYERLFSRARMDLDVQVVDCNDHSFSTVESSAQVVDSIDDWVRRYWPVEPSSTSIAPSAGASVAPQQPVVARATFEFLSVSGCDLWVSLTLPDGDVDASKVAVIVSPMLVERTTSYSSVVALAVALADHGWTVVQYDARDSGESDSCAAPPTWSEYGSDLKSVVDWTTKKTGANEITVIGLRMGATLSMVQTTRDSRIRQAVLLDAIIEGAPWVRQMVCGASIGKGARESPVTEPGCVDVSGIRVSESLLSDMAATNLLEVTAAPDASYVVWGLSRVRAASEKLALLHEHLAAQATARLVETPGPHFWSRIGRVVPPQIVARIVSELEATPAEFVR